MELTRALRLSGWKLRIDQRLRLQHFMPSNRLQWTYLRRLQRKYSRCRCCSRRLFAAQLVVRTRISALAERSLVVSVRKVRERNCQTGRVQSRLRFCLRAKGGIRSSKLSSSSAGIIGLLQNSKRYGELRREIRDTDIAIGWTIRKLALRAGRITLCPRSKGFVHAAERLCFF